MFFSVIIPTYNPRRYLSSLLDSIKDNECKNDIEVIISDDVSTEKFDDIVSKYNTDLNIVSIANEEHYGAPIEGRKRGADISSGKWICFIDQDDLFVSNAFDKIKESIEENDIHNYIITNIYVKDVDGNLNENRLPGNITHGKFYEKEFWNRYKVGYTDNMRYCEDIGLSVNINCILYENRLNWTNVEEFTYIWQIRDDSLSNASGFKEYFFKSFPDYIRGTLGVYVTRYNEITRQTKDLDDFYRFNISSIIFYLYFYFMGMRSPKNKCPKIPKKYYKEINNYYKQFKKITKWNNREFLHRVVDDYLEEYTKARNISLDQISFIECETFEYFIKHLGIRSL